MSKGQCHKNIKLHLIDLKLEQRLHLPSLWSIVFEGNKQCIVANSRPPACDRPRTSNRNRVAHRSDNSVVTLLELSPETSHGWGFNLTTAQSAFYPREIG